MTATKLYFSIQYSAIQKTVLRHDRLWSIAGISNSLARMNEIILPDIASQFGGETIVAGGGKFTARFKNEADAKAARKECEKHLAISLPMLEIQLSSIYPGESFQQLGTDRSGRNPALLELAAQKRNFRGYAVSFNPHLRLCDECGEYPAQESLYRGRERDDVCRICHAAFQESRDISEKRNLKGRITTLELVYRDYFASIKANTASIKLAADFNDLFPISDDERKRMAVWFSDLNSMNDKVPIWLRQENEDNVRETFGKFRATVVKIIVDALAKTFPSPDREFLPFRLVVAGGDDLCLVMAEKDVLAFASNISAALHQEIETLPDTHPLSLTWLRNHGFDEDKRPKPFGFGASFIVTSVHTPFSQIHHLGEELMVRAKRITNRQGNSVDWRIMAEEEAVTDRMLSFERPLFIETTDCETHAPHQLSFNQYLALVRKYKPKISHSHLQQIIAIMQEESDPDDMDRRLKLLDASEADKSFSPLIRDPLFRTAKQSLLPERITTLFELMTIGGGVS